MIRSMMVIPNMMKIEDLRPAGEVEAKSYRGDEIRKPHPQNHLIVTFI